MRCLSVKGIARDSLNETGNLSVKNDIMTGDGSLRERLESVASQEISRSMSECVYGWTVAFEQIWTHIIVRVDLNPDSGISTATMDSLRTTWQRTIESRWSDNWASSRSGELPCPFSFEVQWNTGNPHHTVQVHGSGRRSNMTNWDVNDTGAVAAHEYGHMIGHEDEYPDSNCPDRSPVNTGTIMDDVTGTIPQRLIQPFANRLGVNLQSP